jgi:hypothetical protein
MHLQLLRPPVRPAPLRPAKLVALEARRQARREQLRARE